MRFLKVIRAHHLVKNVLVFAPLFFSGKWNLELFQKSSMAFVAFSLLAMAGYVLNDIIDAPKDRLHPVKSKRPIASGEITLLQGYIIGISLAILGLAVSASITKNFSYLCLFYFFAQLLYCLVVKNIVIVEMIWLSLAYVVRLLSGAIASDISLSSWIIITVWLGALVLVLGKRYAEVVLYPESAKLTRGVLSKYPELFLQQALSTVGMATFVVYLLWCNENVERGRFLAIEIFPTSIFIAIGLLYYELLCFDGKLREDPVMVLGTSKVLLSLFGIFVLYFGLVIYF